MAFKEFLQNLGENIENLETLQIRTVVVKEFDTIDLKEEDINADGKPKQGIISKIHLATGDIDTFFTEKFSDEGNQLREYHLIKENQGHEIVKRNIELIEKIGKTLVDLVKKQKEIEENE